PSDSERVYALPLIAPTTTKTTTTGQQQIFTCVALFFCVCRRKQAPSARRVCSSPNRQISATRLPSLPQAGGRSCWQRKKKEKPRTTEQGALIRARPRTILVPAARRPASIHAPTVRRCGCEVFLVFFVVLFCFVCVGRSCLRRRGTSNNNSACEDRRAFVTAPEKRIPCPARFLTALCPVSTEGTRVFVCLIDLQHKKGRRNHTKSLEFDQPFLVSFFGHVFGRNCVSTAWRAFRFVSAKQQTGNYMIGNTHHTETKNDHKEINK
uniref:Uncharacterized protein n=1 Tax=Anopheles atroparvus TaxID=41427 RepID=A0AAG5DB72_ANOAO